MECVSISSVRDRLAISRFVNEYKVGGRSGSEAFSAYLNGHDVNNEMIIPKDHSSRGVAVAEIQAKWLSLWDD